MKKRSVWLLLIIFIVLLAGCKYDFILPEQAPVGENISFSSQVAPIFSNGNKCTACHKPGNTSPDLTAANAYSQIITKFVNTANPEQSSIYAYPGSSKHSWKGYTSGEAATILTWIREGAKNN